LRDVLRYKLMAAIAFCHQCKFRLVMEENCRNMQPSFLISLHIQRGIKIERINCDLIMIIIWYRLHEWRQCCHHYHI